MSTRNFMELLRKQQEAGFHVCVGLDSDTSNEKFPKFLLPNRGEVDGELALCKEATNIGESILMFNKAIIDATVGYAACFKINIAFYSKHGPIGLQALYDTIQYIRKRYPEIPIIVDGKRGDIGSTNDGYVDEIFGQLNADATTVPPYMGGESLAPFLKLSDKGFFVLARTSNPGASEFQDLIVEVPLNRFAGDTGYAKLPLYQVVATNVAKGWNGLENVGIVAGATAPEKDLAALRNIIGPMQMLIPGVGAQGGDVDKAVDGACGANSLSFVINSSREIIFASSDLNFAQAARSKAAELHHAILRRLKSRIADYRPSFDILTMCRKKLEVCDFEFVDRLLTSEELLHIAKELGAFWQYNYSAADAGKPGKHALLKSKLHSDGFFISKILLASDNILELMARQMVMQLHSISTAIPWRGVYVGGIPDGATRLGNMVAKLLSAKPLVMKKVKGAITIETELEPSASILLVEDFCTRGTGFKEAVGAILASQPSAHILPYDPVIINRGGLSSIQMIDEGEFDILPITEVKIQDWDPESEAGCELCKKYGSKAIKPKETPGSWIEITTSQR